MHANSSICRHPLRSDGTVFTGYACPGAPDIDFWGCPVDRRIFTSVEGNSLDSDYWRIAKENQIVTTESSGGVRLRFSAAASVGINVLSLLVARILLAH